MYLGIYLIEFNKIRLKIWPTFDQLFEIQLKEFCNFFVLARKELAVIFELSNLLKQTLFIIPFFRIDDT